MAVTNAPFNTLEFPDRKCFVTARPFGTMASKYIAYYYFHHANDPEYEEKYTYYPNYRHALTIYRNSAIVLTPESSIVTPSATAQLHIIYAINLEKSVTVQLRGKFDKIGVVFHPLGINHFINAPLQAILQDQISVFDAFGTEFEEQLQKVYQEETIVQKTALLDAFFERQFVAFEVPGLQKAVQEIIHTNGTIKVAALAESLGINRKTLLRQFQKHLCCTIEAYKKSVRFRNTLNYAQQNREHLNLTDVALYNLYYDQSHFNHEFRSITQITPATLLSKISTLGSEELYWTQET